MTRAVISGTGFHVPERVVTNQDLEKIMDTSDAWIIERTGIRERRFVEADTGTSDLGLAAAHMAIEDAGLQPADIDFIIFATITPDYAFPGCGVQLQEQLELPTVGAMDIHNACSGFVYGLSCADAFIRSGQYRRILVVGGEVQSTGLNLTTEGRDMAVLFGDGAGAVVVEAGEAPRGVLATALHSEGVHAKELWAEAPSSRVKGRVTHEMIDAGRLYPQMNGRQVFKNATTRFPEVIHEVLEKTGESLDDVALIIPHQANQRISDAVGQRLGVPPEKVFQNIQKYGNTTAGSIPIALAEARREGRVNEGDLVVLAAFGGGFAWGAAAIRW